MAIYARCCGKSHKIIKEVCSSCGKKFTRLSKYIVQVKDPETFKWSTKTVFGLSLAKKVEIEFRQEIVRKNILCSKKDVKYDYLLEYEKEKIKIWGKKSAYKC